MIDALKDIVISKLVSNSNGVNSNAATSSRRLVRAWFQTPTE